MLTTEQQLQAARNWIESTKDPNVDAGLIYSLIGNFQRYGLLTVAQQQALDDIIEKYQVVLENYLD